MKQRAFTPPFLNDKLVSGRAGFTLLEMMVVIVIFGILGTVAFPGIYGLYMKAKLKEVETTVAVISAAEKIYFYRTGYFLYWNDWEKNYTPTFPNPQVEPKLNIVIPKGNQAVAEYCASMTSLNARDYFQIVRFRRREDNVVMGSYVIYNQSPPPASGTYDITSGGWWPYLKSLDSNGIPDNY